MLCEQGPGPQETGTYIPSKSARSSEPRPMGEHVERTRSAVVIPVIDEVETDLLQNPAARDVLHGRVCPQVWRIVGIRVLVVPPHQRECQLSGQAVAP